MGKDLNGGTRMPQEHVDVEKVSEFRLERGGHTPF